MDSKIKEIEFQKINNQKINEKFFKLKTRISRVDEVEEVFEEA